MINNESQLNFNESWLTEMPRAIYSLDKAQFFETMLEMIEEFLKKKIVPVKISQNLSKLVTSSAIYYWYHENTAELANIDEYLKSIVLIGGFSVRPNNLTVTGIAKRPGAKINAAQLYLDVLADQRSTGHAAIRLTSDDTMTIGGLSVWQKLFAAGHKLYYVNADRPEVLNPITNIKYLSSLYGHSDAYSNFQFVLTENEEIGSMISESFELNRLRTLTLSGIQK
jgi:hypothetical protein